MNLVIIPFHDWRKNCKEGFRTRDAHFIQAFEKNKNVSKILIINRPTSLLEILIKNFSRYLSGEIIKSKRGFELVKISQKVYVVDFISHDFLGQIIKKHKWFISKYQSKSYIDFINESIAFLGMDNHKLIIQNVFSGGISNKLKSTKVLFDAWDNFLKFPAYSKIYKQLNKLYQKLSINSDMWISNSTENINFFNRKFKVKNLRLIKNGVTSDLFLGSSKDLPTDLANIPRPIVGFGGKVTHLLNVDLMNYIAYDNPNFSFVLVGQILDKEIFKKIKKSKNLFYLGDKHYSIYPNYIKNFDIYIIPYQIDKKQHGGDSIKAYEYLSTGKKVIGTRGNGLEDLEEYLYIADTYEDFSFEIKNYKKNTKEKFNPAEYSWTKKAKEILQLI